MATGKKPAASSGAIVTATVYFFPNFGNASVTARIARLVVPGIPHHVTQRGNRRERTFFDDSDYRLYRD
jgi:putative transposase